MNNEFSLTGCRVKNLNSGKIGIILRQFDNGMIQVLERIEPKVICTHDSWKTLQLIDEDDIKLLKDDITDELDISNQKDIWKNLKTMRQLYKELLPGREFIASIDPNFFFEYVEALFNVIDNHELEKEIQASDAEKMR